MPTNDPTATIGDIYNEVASTLYDNGLRWFSSNDIMNSIQDQYNKAAAQLCPIEKSTLIPKNSSPYYNMNQLNDYMFPSAIFNPTTNLWLQGMTYKAMKSDYQTYFIIGEPRYYNVVDFRRLQCWPYLPNASSALYLIYKATAPIIDVNHIPILPHSIASQLLEYSTIADLMEQAREFKKAQLWWDRLYKPLQPNGKSIMTQVKLEIKELNRMDRELVLEPYRWIFHGGQFRESMWISNETPSGTINGTNPTFTLSRIPSPTGSLLLFTNMGALLQGDGYTLSGSTITYNSGYIPQTGDVLRAWYQSA